MDFETFLKLTFSLVAVHWLLDYPLQGDFLSKAKQSGPLRVYHLVAHSGIQGAGVMFVTGSVWLGLAEWTLHALIDEAKVRGKTGFDQDQALHLACKMLWVIIILFQTWAAQ